MAIDRVEVADQIVSAFNSIELSNGILGEKNLKKIIESNAGVTLVRQRRGECVEKTVTRDNKRSALGIEGSVWYGIVSELLTLSATDTNAEKALFAFLPPSFIETANITDSDISDTKTIASFIPRVVFLPTFQSIFDSVDGETRGSFDASVGIGSGKSIEGSFLTDSFNGENITITFYDSDGNSIDSAIVAVSGDSFTATLDTTGASAGPGILRVSALNPSDLTTSNSRIRLNADVSQLYNLFALGDIVTYTG